MHDHFRQCNRERTRQSCSFEKTHRVCDSICRPPTALPSQVHAETRRPRAHQEAFPAPAELCQQAAGGLAARLRRLALSAGCISDAPLRLFYCSRAHRTCTHPKFLTVGPPSRNSKVGSGAVHQPSGELRTAKRDGCAETRYRVRSSRIGVDLLILKTAECRIDSHSE